MTQQTEPEVAVFIVSSSISLSHLSGIPAKLVARGWEVHVISGGPAVSAAHYPSQALSQHTIRMERAPSFFQDFLSLLQITKILRRLKPDLLVTATPKASLLGTFVGWVLRIPSRIYFLWGLRLEGQEALPMKMLLWVLERLTAKFSTRIVAVGPSLAARYLRVLGLKEKGKVKVLGSGSASGAKLARREVPASKREKSSARMSMGLEQRTFTLGFVGRITEEKGILHFIEAVELVNQNGHPIQALVVGRQDSKQASLTLPSASEAPYLKHFQFVEDLSSAFLAMDILVLPSYREGLPSVVLEAAAAGVPSILFPFAGWEDSILNGETGILSPANSVSLAERIILAIERPDYLDQLARAAYSRVGEFFEKEAVETKIVEFLARESAN